MGIATRRTWLRSAHWILAVLYAVLIFALIVMPRDFVASKLRHPWAGYAALTVVLVVLLGLMLIVRKALLRITDPGDDLARMEANTDPTIGFAIAVGFLWLAGFLVMAVALLIPAYLAFRDFFLK